MHSANFRWFTFLSAFVVYPALCAIGGCGSRPAKIYPVQGEVVSADAPKKTLILSHGEIPGLMPAMTMSYPVAEPKEIESLGPSDKISAELVVADGKSYLKRIVLLQKAAKNPPSPTPAATPAAKEDSSAHRKDSPH